MADVAAASAGVPGASAREPSDSAGEPADSAGEPGDSPVAWPWRLQPDSWFTFDFGEVSSKDPVDFISMFQSARKAVGERYVKVWAHNACDSSVRNSVFKRVVRPHARKDLQMQIVLDEDSAVAFADGSALRVADLCEQDVALMRPVWNVGVEKREIKPKQVVTPLQWATSARVTIDPGCCIRVTAALS